MCYYALKTVLQAAFSAFQDWSSTKVMKSIKNMMPSSTTVIRNGVEMKKPAEELVVGDLVLLTYGTKVPADIRLVEAQELKFDKSMLTGESEAVEGTVESTDERYVESKNMAFMTTLITNGKGKGVVVGTGENTMIGKIAKLTTDTGKTKTSLHIELQRFIIIIGVAAVLMAILCITLWSAWLRVKHPDYIKLPDMMVNTISVIVAFIPEGLPVCVTLSLLIVAKRMAKSRVLVKNLATIETLSCVNVIASDKTGTLTQNKMFVGCASAGIDQIDVEQLSKTEYAKDTMATKQLIAVSALCNNAHYDEEDKCPNSDMRRANGDATDIALLRFSFKNCPVKNMHEQYNELHQIPFNSKNKWMMKVVTPKDGALHQSLFGKQDSKIMLLKGAPDILLKKCSSIIQPDGSEQRLDSATIDKLIAIQNEWCVLGQRVIILCKKEVENEALKSDETKALEEYVNKSNDFVIVGMLGITDPPREGIHDVITKCRRAGIRVFMVTGDYALTAAAIAIQVGIFTNKSYDTVEKLKLKMKNKEEISSVEQLKGEGFKAPSSLLISGNELKN